MKENVLALIYAIFEFKCPEVSFNYIQGIKQVDVIEDMFGTITILRENDDFTRNDIAGYVGYSSGRVLQSRYCHMRTKRNKEV